MRLTAIRIAAALSAPLLVANCSPPVDPLGGTAVQVLVLTGEIAIVNRSDRNVYSAALRGDLLANWAACVDPTCGLVRPGETRRWPNAEVTHSPTPVDGQPVQVLWWGARRNAKGERVPTDIRGTVVYVRVAPPGA
jgi:hypothetical protein